MEWVMLPDTGRHVDRRAAGEADAWADNGYQARHAAFLPVREDDQRSDIPVTDGWLWE